MGLAPDQPSIATSEILEKAEADRVNLLEEFIAILGHDLTSPLSAIRMSPELTSQAAIAADALPGLFQPFRRRAGSSGLGLGLYIAQQIVQAHGGRLEAHSSEPDGTTLIVRL